jgi:hypothetical protein
MKDAEMPYYYGGPQSWMDTIDMKFAPSIKLNSKPLKKSLKI